MYSPKLLLPCCGAEIWSSHVGVFKLDFAKSERDPSCCGDFMYGL
jgi:hypothetical protein